MERARRRERGLTDGKTEKRRAEEEDRKWMSHLESFFSTSSDTRKGGRTTDGQPGRAAEKALNRKYLL